MAPPRLIRLCAIDNVRTSTHSSVNERRTRASAKTIRRRVAQNGVTIGGEYVDWFTDDEDARMGYRIIVEQQGYKVKSVTIGNPCIVEIE